jgi:hypothetical protein
LALSLLVLLLLAGAAVGYQAWSLNAWLDEASRTLRPWPVVLIDQGRLARGAPAIPPKPDSESAGPRVYDSLDALILATQARDREVEHLSRDVPRRDPLGRGWWARIFMRTKLADGNGPGRSLALAIRYQKLANDRFALTHIQTLGI